MANGGTPALVLLWLDFLGTDDSEREKERERERERERNLFLSVNH